MRPLTLAGIVVSAAVLVVLLVLFWPAGDSHMAPAAQVQVGQRLSLHESADVVVSGATISVTYGGPYVKGRKIFGGLVPYGEVWRTGADEATTFTTELELDIGGVKVPKGSYTLYTLPRETSSALIISTQPGQWGMEYDPSRDLARVDLQKETLANPVEQFTISFDRRGTDAAVMKLAWEHTLWWVPLRDARSPDPANPPQVPPFSPPGVAELTLEGKTIRIEYGRPFRRGRTIMGNVVPYGQVWRTGANDPTALTTDADLIVGATDVPKGAYTLYTLPSEQTWQLIVNKRKRAGVTAPGMSHEMHSHDPAQDLARLDLVKETIPDTVEQFTIWFEPTGARSAVLKLAWEHTLLSIPLEVK
jgi:hypothetical protein